MVREKIIVFDSGVGGASVLSHLRRMLPHEDFLYFGDDANAPYGVRSTEQIRKLTLEAIGSLLKQYPTKAVVVACNTATAAAIEDLRKAYPTLIVVGIEPAVKPAADRFAGGRVGIMATDATLREKKLSDLLGRFDGKCEFVGIRAPGLVELVEQGLGNSDQCRRLLEPVLSPYRGKLDALVLGCTHYPFAREPIAQILGGKTLLLDGGEGTARETCRRLVAADRCCAEDREGRLMILHSGSDPCFAQRIEALIK